MPKKAPMLLAGLLGMAIAQAEVPGLLNFQGRIISGGSVFDGTGQFKFALVNDDGTTSYWLNSPDGNSDGEPDEAVSVPVIRGLYSILIGDGSVENMGALGVEVFENEAIYLRVWFNDGENGFQMLAPDQRVAASGYALMAASIVDGAVGLEKLASGVLAAGNISGTFSEGQIPPLDAAKIVSGTLQDARLSGNVALKNPDLLTTSNALTGEISALAAQLAALSAQLAGLTNGTPAELPTGMTVVSQDALDADLISSGYVRYSRIVAPEWQNGAGVDSPSGRFSHTTIWTGTEMIVWGGLVGGGQDSAQGGAYDPAADDWRLLSTLDAPLRRSGHSAVWSGTEMIVWGGYSTAVGGYVRSGGRIAGSGGSGWSELETVGAPEERDEHSAIWTGTQMVVWGGKNADGLLASGGSYDPEGNSWTATPTSGAPSARFGAPAVMAGEKILIWGGEGENGALGTGGQLLTAAGVPTEWLAMSELDAPTARFGHTMVWTGSKLLVWGGRNGGGYLNSGGIYDPATDVWEAMNAAGAPAGRQSHIAVWTGSEMVVFGGENAGGALSSGGAFNPTTGEWRSLSSGGGPLARSEAGAVWTGTEVVVFGGRSAGSPIGATQILTPEPTWYLYRKL